MSLYYACWALDWPHSKGALAWDFYEKEFIKTGTFTIKNQKLSPSPIYIDLRTPSNPNPGKLTREDVKNATRELVREVFLHHIRYDFVVGIPNAGDPFASEFLESLGDNSLRYRALLYKQGSGENRKIVGFRRLSEEQRKEQQNGDDSSKKRVLVIDDVVSGGDSKFEAIKAIEEAGCEVAAVAVIVDREQGGSEALEKRGCKVISVFKLSALLAFYVLTSRIAWQEFEDIMGYIDRSRKILCAENKSAS